MRSSYIRKAVSIILKAIAVCTLVPTFVAFYFREKTMVCSFLLAGVIAFLLSIFLSSKSSCNNLNDIKKSEALFITAVAWILFGLISTIPFLFCNLSVIDSLFEAFSGTTATGVTILKDFSLYPKTILFWRSFIQWLGGMGIIVLFIAILPQFAIAGRQMFSVEVPGPTEQKITPRIRNTANFLWKIYFILTLLEIIILKLLGMPLFSAVCNSLSTLSTGGFSPDMREFIGSSTPILWTVGFFMFIAASSFPLLYQAILKRNPLIMFKDEEFRCYFFTIIFIALAIASALIIHNNYDFIHSLGVSLFQTVSIITTTNFSCVDYHSWNLDAKMFLFLLFFVGGCSGSTAGGLKIIRVLFLFKFIKREVLKILHPNAVYNIKINKIIFPEEVNKQIIGFIMFYFLIFAVSAFLIILIEQNVTFGATTAAASLGNFGAGFFGKINFSGYGELHTVTKIICILNMIVGRLELIPFFAMLHPDFWNWKK